MTSPKSSRKRSGKVGLPPGSLVYTGDKTDRPFEITTTIYNEQEYRVTTHKFFRECPLLSQEATGVTWINVNGLHHTRNLEELGECFHLHPLVLEDILNTDQRPKMDDYGDYLFIVLKLLRSREGLPGIAAEQLSLILGNNYVISLHENHEDVLALIRERLQTGKGRLRRSGADYLAYSLVDLIVDQYFVILEDLGEIIEDLETEVVSSPTPATLSQIHRLKREMIMLRKSVWPLREVISRLLRSESPLITGTTALYLKDVYDHVIQIIDNIETFRDILSGLLDIYLSSVSNRLNEVMKVLTIIATIFIPLTFIAGVYGMNFKYMPELEWPWGYFLILSVMLLVALLMLLFFKQKGWIGPGRTL
uniref:Magnesium transport protein CorA n=1 Tax=Desulfobacca acetoxidans TaxID=60893 RepID=A0A7C3ZE03_9BACT